MFFFEFLSIQKKLSSKSMQIYIENHQNKWNSNYIEKQM